MLNIFKKKKIISGIKITAVRGKDEIILWLQNTPDIACRGIQVPNGYDLLTEIIYKEDEE